MRITFITGNANKAAYVAKALGQAISHHRLDLDEIQSLDLPTIITHKAKQAYDHLQSPVLVEDVSLEFHAFGRLPGPFIKWFIDEIGNEKLCDMLGRQHGRAATARICYGLYDGKNMRLFEGSMAGHIAPAPRGQNGFGWDQIFIKDGQRQTRAELDEPTERATSMRRAPLEQITAHLATLDS